MDDGTAEDIPLDTDSVSSVVAILSTHHFSSLENAAKEMTRVSNRSIVIFTYDPRLAETYWLADYFPDVFERDYSLFPPLSEVAMHFENAGMQSTIAPFVIPMTWKIFFWQPVGVARKYTSILVFGPVCQCSRWRTNIE